MAARLDGVSGPLPPTCRVWAPGASSFLGGRGGSDLGASTTASGPHLFVTPQLLERTPRVCTHDENRLLVSGRVGEFRNGFTRVGDGTGAEQALPLASLKARLRVGLACAARLLRSYEASARFGSCHPSRGDQADATLTSNPVFPDRIATAPYNFVPLPERVFEAAGRYRAGRRRDQAVGDARSLRARDEQRQHRARRSRRYPSLIRGAIRQRHDGAWDNRHSRLRPDPYTTPDGYRAFPGRAYGGMVRTLVEILSFSKISLSRRNPFL